MSTIFEMFQSIGDALNSTQIEHRVFQEDPRDGLRNLPPGSLDPMIQHALDESQRIEAEDLRAPLGEEKRSSKLRELVGDFNRLLGARNDLIEEFNDSQITELRGLIRQNDQIRNSHGTERTKAILAEITRLGNPPEYASYKEHLLDSLEADKRTKNKYPHAGEQLSTSEYLTQKARLPLEKKIKEALESPDVRQAMYRGKTTHIFDSRNGVDIRIINGEVNTVHAYNPATSQEYPGSGEILWDKQDGFNYENF